MAERWRELMTRKEAIELFGQLAARITREGAELRELRAFIQQRWGRHPPADRPCEAV